MQIAATLAAALLCGNPLLSTDFSADTLSVARVSADKSRHLSSTAPLQQISASQIELRGALHLDEVLKTLPGVSVKDYGGIGGLKTVSVRSLGAQHTAVVYNGMLISDAQNGQTDIGRFSLSGIKEISVETGVSDNMLLTAKAGSMAGVVSIVSKDIPLIAGDSQLEAGVMGGSFGTANPWINYRRRLNSRWGISAMANMLSSKGNYPFTIQSGTQSYQRTRFNSDVTRLNSELRLSGDLGRWGNIGASLNYLDSERGLPGSVVLYTENREERLWDNNFIGSLSYDVSLGSAVRLKAGAGFNSLRNRYLDTNPAYPEPQLDNYHQTESSFSAALLYNAGERLQFALAQDLYYNTLVSNVHTESPKRLCSYTSLRGKYSWKGLTINASLTETSFDLASPAASISYKLPFKEDIRLRAFWKKGFRLPTFNDLYYARIGNPNLRPEKARQFGGGLTWEHAFKKGAVSMTADAYSNMVEDKIVAVPTMFIWHMRNVGLVHMTGADLSADAAYSIAKGYRLSGKLGYSYQYAVDITDPSAKNYRHQIAYTPRHSGSAVLAAQTPWCNISYSLQACGERYSLAQNAPAYRLDPYADHSICISRDVTLSRCILHLSAEALNLAGDNYQIIQYYPMPGRNYRISIKITI